MIEFWPCLPAAVKPLGRCIPMDFSADLARWKLSKRMAGREYAPCCAMAPQLRVFVKILCLHLWKLTWNPNIGFVDVSPFSKEYFQVPSLFSGVYVIDIKNTSESSIKRTHACSLHFVSLVVFLTMEYGPEIKVGLIEYAFFSFLCIISRYFRGSILDISNNNWGHDILLPRNHDFSGQELAVSPLDLDKLLGTAGMEFLGPIVELPGIMPWMTLGVFAIFVILHLKRKHLTPIFFGGYYLVIPPRRMKLL